MSRMLCLAIKAAGLSVDAFGSAEEFLDSEASRASVCLILDVNWVYVFAAARFV